VCALTMLRRADPTAEVTLALSRWAEFVEACERHCGTPEHRFLRRAYGRARNDALIALALQAPDPIKFRRSATAARARQPRSSARAARRGLPA
jgi:hypothetical protein